ncbi:hypothetical protein SAMN05421737_10485 [Shouchella lonarensis]|uniref:AP2 domain-containing protein n=1 Tax=Shouchella lonarensis TaxID=1464122 RepID=A0A1G6HN09_9BACI|nr:hypothetical protein SAMN05421737_10485 [Shouchella lonarensis]
MRSKTRLIDLTGKQFEQWLVIKEAPRRKNIRYWLCKCSCGTTKAVAQRTLINGTSKSCGCYAKKSGKKLGRKCLDLTGQTFGSLTVLKKVDLQRWSKYWLCKCSCGKELTISHQKLVNNYSESCNCYQQRGWKRIDLTGRTYGQFIVLKEAAARYGKRHWLCQCTTCGTTREVNQSRLTTGTIKSCPCSQDLDLTGHTYGHLTVLKKSAIRKQSRYWLCQCSCGNIIEARQWRLTNRNIRSCGCRRKSDLRNHQYGQLTVLEEAESRYGKRFWLCQCSCGTTKVIAQRYLTAGRARSCGCNKKRKALLKENISHVDKTGTELAEHTYGRLTVIKEGPRRYGERHWLCRCSCGKEREIREYSLKKGLTKSCGCLAKGKRKKNYVLLPGQQFNDWTVLEESPRKNKYRYWRCKCACGTEKDVAQRSLTSGASKSCGCQSKLTKNRGKDLTGQHIHAWTVIEEAPRRHKLRYWRCRCLCGTEKDIAQHSLVTGQSKSCGCRSKRDS